MVDEADKLDEDLQIQEVVSDICCNMVRCEPTDSTSDEVCWRFCHLSVREYFEKHHYSVDVANTFVLASSFKYMVQEDLQLEMPTRSPSYPHSRWLKHMPLLYDSEGSIQTRLIHFQKLFLGSFEYGSP